MTDKMFNDIIDSIINNATDDEIEIIREKLNNHIINHVYDGEVHKELSDEFDSSSCPHCGHEYIIKYGKDKNGNQRYLCKHCHKTFSPMTGTLFSYSKKEAYSNDMCKEKRYLINSIDIYGYGKTSSYYRKRQSQ